jgi:hypothetical protein
VFADVYPLMFSTACETFKDQAFAGIGVRRWMFSSTGIYLTI